MSSNTEINFQRLLTKCEELAANKKYEDWRYEKYVSSLEDLLKLLSKSSTNKLLSQNIKEYSKRVEFLKELSTHNKSSNSMRSLPTIVNSRPVTTSKDTHTRQLYQQLQANHEKQLRDDLFHTVGGSGDSSTSNSNLDIDKLLQLQQEQQDKTAEEMIEVAARMKEVSMQANDILKKDNARLSKVNEIADKNAANLKVENERVNKNLRNCCNCWIYLMVIIVFIVFMMMVLFMKIFPKRKYSVEIFTTTKAYHDLSNINKLNSSSLNAPFRNDL